MRSPDGGDIGSTDADVMRMSIVIALHITDIAQMGAAIAYAPECMGSCFLVLDGTRLLRIFPLTSPSATIHPSSQFGSAVMYRKSGSINRSPISLLQDNQGGAVCHVKLHAYYVCGVRPAQFTEIHPKMGTVIPQNFT